MIHIRIGLVAVLVLLFSACSAGNAEGDTNSTPRISVEDLRYTEGRTGYREVTGNLNNPGKRDIRHAMVQVVLYDEHNATVDTLNIEVRDIAAGKLKEFRQRVDVKADVRRVRVRGVLVL